MNAPAYLRSPRLPRVGAWLVVVAFGIVVAFHWLREAAATPPPSAIAPPPPAVDLEAAVAQAAAVPLFGEAPASGPSADSAPLEFKLKGVLAGNGGPVVAIVNSGGEEDELVMLGAELRPGVRLEGVHPTHIVVSRGGVAQRVELEPVRSDSSRGKDSSHAGGKRSTHIPPQPAQVEAGASTAGTEPASEQPLAPPMPQSSAAPDPLIPAA